MTDNKIKIYWEQFIRTGKVEPDKVRSEIVASWQRCLHWGVDPGDGLGRDILKEPELTDRRKRCALLMEVARPYMLTLYQCVQGSGFMVVLADREGYLLDTCGDVEILEQATNQVRFVNGANWSEQAVGTNAIGTSLFLEKPIQISGAEHFCITHHNWTCSAAPIRDTDGNVIGCLNMSGPRHLVHSHTLGMIVAAVEAIENQLRKDRAQEEKKQAYKILETVTESMSEGLMALDYKGNIVHLNSAACRILGVSRDHALGQDYEKVLGKNDKIYEVIYKRQKYSDEEIIVHSSGKQVRCISSARPIVKEDGSFEGVVFTLREINKVHRLVHRIVGATARFTCADIIGDSDAIKGAKRSLMVAANSQSNVLLLGESGTGKELFAQAIHNHSNRRKGPFIAVNCGALPRELIQSELFGYNEGAFTGAKRGGNPGKFELANGGTIFLDEIGDMPMELQVNLLRVLQERRIVRLGGNDVIPLDVRVIAASNKNLYKEVEEGKFRTDLFYRLNVFTIHIPPLRERGNDIELLTLNLIDRFASQFNKVIKGVEPGFFEVIKNYSWPGNVRELQNVLEYVINVTEGNYLLIKDLPKGIFRHRRPVNRGVLVRPLHEIERDVVESALVQFNGNVTRAAEALGIGRNTLYYKLKKYNINFKC